MQNPILTERIQQNKAEIKYAVEEVLVLLSFAVEGLKYMDSDYRTPSAILSDKRMIFVDLISRHPAIESAKKEIEFVRIAILNYMKDNYGSNYQEPMEIVDEDKNGVHTLTEKLTGECIIYSDSKVTALLSIRDILRKACLKIQQNLESYGSGSFYDSLPGLNKIAADMCLAKLLQAKILIKSLTYTIN